MVGLWFLVPAIGVRVPDRQQSAGRECVHIHGLCCCSLDRDSKDGAGTQDERSEGLSASRGREYLVDLERGEQIYLVIRDRVPGTNRS